MFPLGTVLLPGAVIPLHVFEPRYRALVRDCLAAPEHEFGIVLIARGHEVGGGDHRLDVGTVARMMQVAELDDGRFAMVCVGTRRIRVNAWLPDDPYPLADVDDWPDEPVGDDRLEAFEVALAAAAARVQRAAALAAELGDSVAGVELDLGRVDDPVAASYAVCAVAPVGAADTQALLCEPHPAARVARLLAMLDDLEAVLDLRLALESTPLDLDEP
jgi:Lon protease-like protein